MLFWFARRERGRHHRRRGGRRRHDGGTRVDASPAGADGALGMSPTPTQSTDATAEARRELLSLSAQARELSVRMSDLGLERLSRHAAAVCDEMVRRGAEAERLGRDVAEMEGRIARAVERMMVMDVADGRGEDDELFEASEIETDVDGGPVAVADDVKDEVGDDDSASSEDEARKEKKRRRRRRNRRRKRSTVAVAPSSSRTEGTKPSPLLRRALLAPATGLLLVLLCSAWTAGRGSYGLASPDPSRGLQQGAADPPVPADSGPAEAAPEAEPAEALPEEADPIAAISYPPTSSFAPSGPTPVPTPFPTASDSPTDSPTEPPEPDCEDKANSYNPKCCGYLQLSQTDYRGRISTTASGYECIPWSESYYPPEDYPDADLAKNYCRNPDGDVRAWCFNEENGYEYCDVPYCTDSLPSLSPSESNVPTTSLAPSGEPSSSAVPSTSIRPTLSFAPTLPPACDGEDPNVCGCGAINQIDYRGRVSETKGGETCDKWDADWLKAKYADWLSQFPESGIDGNNYCRNPGNLPGGAWCITKDEDGNFLETDCSIPYCFPEVSKCEPYFSDADGTVAMTAQLEYACAYHKCAGTGTSSAASLDPTAGGDGDSNQNDNLFDERHPSLEGVKSQCLCPFELWDCNYGSKECERDRVRKASYECCAADNDNYENSLNRTSWAAASCECSIKTECEVGRNAEKCDEYAENCCADDDHACKCDFWTKACRIGLEVDTENRRSYCIDASDSCCRADGKNGFMAGGCKCDFYEPLCNEYPNTEYADVCRDGANSCCGESNCKCDFYTWAIQELEYYVEEEDNEVEATCVRARSVELNRTGEVDSLLRIYRDTGGAQWTSHDLWGSKTDHCKWFGIVCDDEGFITAIELRGNNLVGKFPADSLSRLTKLQFLDLAINSLSGTMAGTDKETGDPDSSIFFKLRELYHIDLSQNELRGEVDVLLAPAIEHADFSYNAFDSLNSFKSFKRSHETIAFCAISNNNIKQNATHLMQNMPIHLVEYILSDNMIQGTLPTLEYLPNLFQLSMDSNSLSGTLPDFSIAFPWLEVLSLSYQKVGFTGPIPASISNLQLLRTLDLAGNQLTGTIPPSLGNYLELLHLDLSSNKITSRIPPELENLKGKLQLMNFSNNMLNGTIPVQLGEFEDTLVLLKGNTGIWASPPAPLSLCFVSGFDLKVDENLCPPERNALHEFYFGTKGVEWTHNSNWVKEYISICSWYGVKCTSSNNVIALQLQSNGLSGTLNPSISELRSLEILDLSDNEIKGSIPTEIGLLSHLTELKLKYNLFRGNETNFGSLQNLELISLQGNRLSGTIPPLNLSTNFVDEHSYIADCGNPSDFEESLTCEECTMCCNAQGDCYPTEESPIQSEFGDYVVFSGIFFASLLGICCAIALGSFAVDRFKNRDFRREFTRRNSYDLSIAMEGRDKKDALDFLGEDSVNQFFLGNKVAGWMIVLLVMASQLWMLFIFVVGSEIDLSDDAKDLVYYFKCTRDQDECNDTSDLTFKGWIAFAILMAAHVLKDTINSTKMIVLSAKERHDFHTKLRLFIGGYLLFTVTLFTLYVTTIYNAAIATSDTEIIMNSVVILFIMDIDEMFFDILVAINADWVDTLTLQVDDDEEDDYNVENDAAKDDDEKPGEQYQQKEVAQEQAVGTLNVPREVQLMKKEIQILHRTLDMLMEKNAGVEKRLSMTLPSQSIRVC